MQQGTVLSREEVVQSSLLCTGGGLYRRCIGESVKDCGKSFVKNLFHEIVLQYLNGTSLLCALRLGLLSGENDVVFKAVVFGEAWCLYPVKESDLLRKTQVFARRHFTVYSCIHM